MACTLAALQASGCTSGIDKVTDPIQLLQLIAQLSADTLTASGSALAVTPAAIQARGCTSGIEKVTDQTQLLQIIAQLNCDLSA